MMASPPSAIPKILTYHSSVAGTGTGKATFRRALPAHLRDCVVSYHSDLSEAAKKDIWEGFLSGRYRILCATDAAGMDCNVPDIEYSIVFECPSTRFMIVDKSITSIWRIELSKNIQALRKNPNAFGPVLTPQEPRLCL